MKYCKYATESRPGIPAHEIHRFPDIDARAVWISRAPAGHTRTPRHADDIPRLVKRATDGLAGMSPWFEVPGERGHAVLHQAEPVAAPDRRRKARDPHPSGRKLSKPLLHVPGLTLRQSEILAWRAECATLEETGWHARCTTSTAGVIVARVTKLLGFRDSKHAVRFYRELVAARENGGEFPTK